MSSEMELGPATVDDGPADGGAVASGVEKKAGAAVRERGGGVSGAPGPVSGGAAGGGGAAEKASRAAAPPMALPDFVTDPENVVGWAVTSFSEFAAESVRLVRKCSKPDMREFRRIARACAVGFVLMGFIGYIVKLIFIPVNNIIVGG